MSGDAQMMTKSKNQRRMRLALACGTAAIGLLAPFSTFAQDAENATRLDTIRVEQGDPNAVAVTGVEPVRGVVAKSTRTGSKAAMDIN